MDQDDILSQITVSLCCVKLTPSYNEIRRVDVLISNPTPWKIAYKIHTTRKDMLYIKPSYAFIGSCTAANVTLILQTVMKEGFDCTDDRISIYFAVVQDDWLSNIPLLFWRGKEPPKITTRHVIHVSYEQTIEGEYVEKQSMISEFLQKLPPSESVGPLLPSESDDYIIPEPRDFSFMGEVNTNDTTERCKAESVQIVDLNNNGATSKQEFQEKEAYQDQSEKREEKQINTVKHEKEKIEAGTVTSEPKATEEVREKTQKNAVDKETNATNGELQKKNQTIKTAVTKTLSSNKEENNTDKHNPNK
ncbi:hypothetical protein T10_8999 [Trichinella papuae]|uniref:Major sperm protein n=1 Tax=Trichinella papuae TaxID=268474 RepID=A0A0V1M9C5_9BILA|nr:hypothetical protein T10_9419 [Trichinella papuae]KRZ68342.1 hypothetical protein T10_13142 [Trichinella papuae]KRZ68363.1 hypothetical protein T10_8999 [Trichinella papuae]